MAAGAGSRFGGRKQLALVAGKPLITHVLEQLRPVFEQDLYCVTGAYRDEVRPIVAPYARIIEHTGWKQGLGSSIASGIRGISPLKYDGILIALADQIAIRQQDYLNLLRRFEGDNIVAALYAGNAAVPALFPARCFEDLARLQGDRGARQLLRKTALPVTAVPMPSAEADIDTTEDLENKMQNISAIW